MEKRTGEDWKNVLFSDESFYQLYPPPSRQNDRVWTPDAASVPTAPSVKFPAKLMVCEMMSHQGLSELHVIPPKTKVDTKYYVKNTLQESCLPAINRTPSDGSVLERRMVADKLKSIFMQDGASAHRSATAQRWCRDTCRTSGRRRTGQTTVLT